jgi:heme exporter protein D
MDPANHQRQRIEWQGALREFWAMPWEGYYIWGATAAMLVSLHAHLVEGD